MSTPLSVTERYQNNTSIDVAAYMNAYVTFMEFDYPNIIAYYSGQVPQPNVNSFAELDRLRQQAIILDANIRQNASRFQSTEDWDLLERLEDIRIKLDTIDQSSKWLRSSITKGSFNINPEVDHSLKQNQTLEAVSRDVSGDLDFNNDYVEIARRNNLREEDYTLDGGVVFQVNLRQSGSGIRINSVVDNMIDDRLYGIDLPTRISFDSEQDDLAVLSFRETVIQAIEILAGLRQNDNPEFPDDGISSETIVGTNRSALLFPLLFRQLYSTFQKDDTLSSFTITNVNIEEDTVSLEYEVQTQRGELFNNTIQL